MVEKSIFQKLPQIGFESRKNDYLAFWGCLGPHSGSQAPPVAAQNTPISIRNMPKFDEIAVFWAYSRR